MAVNGNDTTRCSSIFCNDHFHYRSCFNASLKDTSERILGCCGDSSTNPSGRSSPTNSAHSYLMRTPLRKFCQEKRARKIHFYINADKYFSGIQLAVSSERFRTFEALLEELTRLLADHQAYLPKGVRIVFNTNGTKVACVEELLEGQEYICSSSEPFKNVCYSRDKIKFGSSRKKCHNSSDSTPLLPILPLSTTTSATRTSQSSVSSCYSTPSSSIDTLVIQQQMSRNYIRPRLVTIIRNGVRPRKAIRMLLNKKTAHSFEQVLSDITDAIKLDSGAVRKVFTIDGKQVVCLADFFKEADVFIAYGQERYSHDDFDLDCDENKLLSLQVRSPISSHKDIISDRKSSLQSPLIDRKVFSTKNDGYKLSKSSSCSTNKSTSSSTVMQRSVPQSLRKIRPKSPFVTSKFQSENDLNSIIIEARNYPSRVYDHFEIGRMIGDGNFAVVRECKDRKTGKDYAMKIIDKAKCRGKEHMIASEVYLMKKVNHPNIVSLHHQFDFNNELYLVIELVKGGDLFDAIATTTKYSEKEASLMLNNLSQAISYLHSKSIVHRDIKPENLLVYEHINGSKSLKLADFGLAIEVSNDTKLYTVCGTPIYVAPEILSETGYGLKVDVWAAGVITFILLCGFPPFCSEDNKQDELFDQILSGEFTFTSPYWNNIGASVKDLIVGMLQVDSDHRLSAVQVVNHPWVKECRPAVSDARSSRQRTPLSNSSSCTSFIPVRKKTCR